METITRKKLLYRSGLGFWCINAAQGCSHGCRYPCYAFMMGRSYGRTSSYEEWCRPKLVSNAAELLEKELAPGKGGRRKELPERVHLSLTTDPFMAGWPEVEALSLKLIEILNAHGIPASVLTKGRLPRELADRSRFPAENTYGISLVSLDEAFREKWEPGAAPYSERVSSLRALAEAGRSTYVHMEPYPTPNIIAQDLGAILAQVDFIDELYFGGWNYNKLATAFPGREDFYREQGETLRRFCEKRGILCRIGD
jgi:DNA repair photolyase